MLTLIDAQPVLENVAGAVIGTLLVTDANPGDSFTFTVNDSRFEVVNDQLKLKADARLDYEAATQVLLDVTATEAGGAIQTSSFTVNVDDVSEIRFAAFGDFDAGPLEQAVADLIADLNVDFVITTGDNTYGPTPIDDSIGQFYSNYIGDYSGAYGSGSETNLFFPTLGNHDYDDDGAGLNGGIDLYLDYFTLPGNERYYDFQMGPVHFFALNSNPGEPDGIDSASIQAQWLQAGLANSDAVYKIVFFHHPPLSSGFYTDPNSPMLWPFEDWGATAVLNGHEHFYERILRDDNQDGEVLPYIVSGLGGASRIGFDTTIAGSAFQYNDDDGTLLIQASDATITFEFWSVAGGGTLIDSYVIDVAGADPLLAGGDDTLGGGSGDDFMNGLAGNDVLNGLQGNDTMIGWTGDDTYYVDAPGDVVFESPLEGRDKVFSSISLTLADHVEDLELTGAAVGGGGNVLNNEIRGNSAGNDLSGGAGADTLLGLGGNDTLSGGDGNDTLTGGSGADSAYGESGNDTFRLSLADAASGELIDGGADTDTLLIDGGGAVSLVGVTVTDIENIELTSGLSTTLTVQSAAQAALITNAAGAADIVHIGGSTDVTEGLVKSLIIDAGVETVTWSIPGYATVVAEAETGGFHIRYTDTLGDATNWQFDTIDVHYNALGQKTNQSQVFDSPGNVGVIANHTFDPATGLATQVKVIDGGDNRTFDTITTTLLNGVVQSVHTVNDNDTDSIADDTIVDQVFQNGQILTETTQDTGGSKPWSSVVREYMNDGVLSTATQVFRTFWDSSLNQHVAGAAGHQVIEGSTGNDALIGGADDDTFRFADGFGHDTVYDFAVGTDLLDFGALVSAQNPGGIHDYAALDAVASITQVALGAGFNTVVDFGNGDQVTLRNMTVAQLGDADFL